MAAFEYEALDSEGHVVKGVMEGDAERKVRGLLREKGFIPVKVLAIAKEPAERRAFTWQTGLKSSELSLLTRQFATLVRAGLPIEECLQALTEQSESARARKILAAVRTHVREGQPLAQALGEFPSSFPPLYRHLIEAGEQSGKLPIILERLADYTEQRQALTQKVWVAFLYPALVTVVAVAVVGGLLVYVVPQIAQVFVDSGAPLPWATRALIALSGMAKKGGVFWLVGLLVLVVGGRMALKDRGRRTAWQGFLLRVPLLGRLIRGLNATRLASTLGILTSSGIPLLSALETAQHVVTNLPMQAAVEEAKRQVREGGSLSRSLGKTKLFPPLVVHLIGSGEASGSLDTMLTRAAEAQARELDGFVTALTSLIEPVLILVMGGMVLFIVLAILLPIFDMNQLIK
ncbi:MAG: type II secretion system inner membrane protein GspF [Acidiferrobacter sp.]